ncbi:nucleoside hydrolase [Planctomycetota bacterium]|nr:nucleoside hydrolase [Planctomycetota bacterium]
MNEHLIRRMFYILVIIVSYVLMSCSEEQSRVKHVTGSERDPIVVWMDVDPANGIGEVDDGLMMIAGFQSKEIDVRGVSVVFGNSPVVYGAAIGGNIVKAFGPMDLKDVGVHVGASSSEELGVENDAVNALVKSLSELKSDEQMVILAVGPVTNIATTIQQYPELIEKIKSIVIVASRRQGQLFLSGEMEANKGKRGGFVDLNFENDIDAMRILMESEVELTFVPWEVSSKVWITREDVDWLREYGGERGAYIYATTQHWFDTWEQEFGAGIGMGFNPFDTLALGYVIAPELFKTEQMTAVIEEGLSDQADEEMEMKDYLIVRKIGEGDVQEEVIKEVTYVHDVDAKKFKEWLISRLKNK